MTGDSRIVFEIKRDRPLAHIRQADEAVDGTKLLSIEQCVDRFGKSADDWRDEWLAAFGSIIGDDVEGMDDSAAAVALSTAKASAVHAARFPHLSIDQFNFVDFVTKQAGIAAHSLIAKIERNEKTEKDEVVLIAPLSVLRARADATGNRRNETEPEFCAVGEDGYKPGPWTKDEPPFAARVFVTRSDTGEVVPGVAYFSRCAQYEGGGKLMPHWQGNRAGGQLGKCAAADAHRRAWPRECGEFLIPEEAGVPMAPRKVSSATNEPTAAATSEVDIEPSLPRDAHSFIAGRNPQPDLGGVIDDVRIAVKYIDEATPDLRRLPMELLDIEGVGSYKEAQTMVDDYRRKLPKTFKANEQAFCAYVMHLVRQRELAPA